jgi:DNA-binding NtrC family response regulator
MIIYAIDDYPGFLGIYRKLLGAETFGHARDLLDAVALKKPDLLVCDLIMPDIDGWTVVDMVRKFHPDLPVIISTSSGTHENDFLAKLYKCEFWQKGTNLHELINIARKYGYNTP